MTTERYNLRHWDDATRGVYEVWYMTWNHPETDQGFWLRYITEAPLEGPSRGELWFARFDPKNPARTFGIHRSFPGVDATRDPFSLVIGGSKLGHDHAIGQVAGRFIAPYAADAASPAAASSATMNVTQPIGANALDVSRAASGPISRHFLISSLLPCHVQACLLASAPPSNE